MRSWKQAPWREHKKEIIIKIIVTFYIPVENDQKSKFKIH